MKSLHLNLFGVKNVGKIIMESNIKKGAISMKLKQ
jgi:hypothetical protein